ncbi:MAG: UDP-N-acetylmuramate--L-alanine ligase [Chlamydiota bacterium]
MNPVGYHLLGIGGIGMSALAYLLIELGYPVSGLDAKETDSTRALMAKGADIFIGLDAPIPAGRTVSYSTAIPEDHPSLQAAKQQQLSLLHRSQLLAELFVSKKPLLVAGSHGKTSTAALLSHTLQAAGLDPSFAIGGISPSLGQNGKPGAGELFVVEADESDGSFLNYHNFAAIITNIDDDHLDYWQTKEKLIEGFQTFIAQIAPPPLLFWCADDPILTALSPPGTSYGTSKEATLRLTAVTQQGDTLKLTLATAASPCVSFTLPLIGNHQALNATAVVGIARALGLLDSQIQAAFQTFRGIKRRLEKKGEIAGIAVYDDYAHHPTALAKTVAALKAVNQNRRLVAIFEPHRFSRMKKFKQAFISSLTRADLVIVTDIFAAGEKPLKKVTATDFCQVMNQTRREQAIYIPRADLLSFIPLLLRPGDVVVTLGAGGITYLGAKLLDMLGYLQRAKPL